MQDFKLTSQPA